MSFNSFIKPATNCGPLSDSAVSGKPCNFQTWSLNNVARPRAVAVECVGMTWHCLVCLQQVTNRASKPWVSGRPVTKSVVISFQGCEVASFGLSFPAGFSGNDFMRWHLLHPDIYPLTSLVILGHQ